MGGYTRLQISVAVGIGALLVLRACSSGLVHEEQLDGPYYLTAVDAQDEMDVSYKVDEGAYVGRIPATVFAVGWNANYIVAKCHPAGDSREVEYYYLDRKLDSKYANPEASIHGPLTGYAFSWASRDLGLPEFSKTLE